MNRRELIRIPFIGLLILHFYRFIQAIKRIIMSAGSSVYLNVKWLFTSKEHTNITYKITTLSRKYIAATVAISTNSNIDTVLELFDEIENDKELHKQIYKEIISSPDHVMTDLTIHFGRRLAWYAVVRIVKPQVVVETGVDKGLGSCLLAAALKRNRIEGHIGYYYGTDINPAAGYLLSGIYKDFGEILYGDSIESLKKLIKTQKIDVFINDSDHSSEYEKDEYIAIEKHLSEKAIIIGDNTHTNDELFKFALRTNRGFLFAAEKSDNHFYPGSGVAFAFSRATKSNTTEN